jgi:hypothetical protein
MDFIEKMRELCEVPTPLIITHDQPYRTVRISTPLRIRKLGESWYAYCERLWIGCWKENGDDNIKLTLHLGILAKAEFMQEISNNYQYAKAFITRVDGTNAYAEQFAENLKTELFGIKVAFDLPEI